MGFGKRLKKIAKRYVGMGLSRKQLKSVRRHLGLTSKNKFFRQVKRSLTGGYVSSSYQPTSASSYIYQPRTISELMGGR